jgi:uncharacterized protein related to proFAR isomerase
VIRYIHMHLLLSFYLEVGARMVYHKRVVCVVSELGGTVEELAEKYNRVSIHLKGSKLHTKKGLKDEFCYIVAHNV